MQSRADATLNLSALLTNAPGAPLELSGEGLLVPNQELLDADGLTLSGPISWEVTVFNAGGDDDFVLNGSARATTVMECRRCLTDVESEVDTSFVYAMEYRPSDKPLFLDEHDAEGADDVLVFGNPEVDFAAFITQLLAIEQPITALCKSDCLGLNLDGVNLNEHPELASTTTPAAGTKPLYDALKDLDLSN